MNGDFSGGVIAIILHCVKHLVAEQLFSLCCFNKVPSRSTITSNLPKGSAGMTVPPEDHKNVHEMEVDVDRLTAR
jgi:hypothetical protein